MAKFLSELQLIFKEPFFLSNYASWQHLELSWNAITVLVSRTSLPSDVQCQLHSQSMQLRPIIALYSVVPISVEYEVRLSLYSKRLNLCVA